MYLQILDLFLTADKYVFALLCPYPWPSLSTSVCLLRCSFRVNFLSLILLRVQRCSDMLTICTFSAYFHFLLHLFCFLFSKRSSRLGVTNSTSFLNRLVLYMRVHESHDLKWTRGMTITTATPLTVGEGREKRK